MVTVQIVLVLAAFVVVTFIHSMYHEMEWRSWLAFVLFCIGVSGFGLFITIIAEPIAIIGWCLCLCAPMFLGEWVYKRYLKRNGGSRKDISLCQRLGVSPKMIRFGYTSDIDGTWYKKDSTIEVAMLNDDELWFYHIKEQLLLEKWEEAFNNDEFKDCPYPEDYTALYASEDEIRKRRTPRLNELIELYSQQS